MHNVFYKDEQITVDMLMEEFDIFCNGGSRSVLIDTYQSNMRSIRNRIHSAGITDDKIYHAEIAGYIRDNYGEYPSADTSDEVIIEASLYVAEEFYNMVLKYEGQ